MRQRPHALPACARLLAIAAIAMLIPTASATCSTTCVTSLNSGDSNACYDLTSCGGSSFTLDGLENATVTLTTMSIATLTLQGSLRNVTFTATSLAVSKQVVLAGDLNTVTVEFVSSTIARTGLQTSGPLIDATSLTPWTSATLTLRSSTTLRQTAICLSDCAALKLGGDAAAAIVVSADTVDFDMSAALSGTPISVTGALYMLNVTLTSITASFPVALPLRMLHVASSVEYLTVDIVTTTLSISATTGLTRLLDVTGATIVDLAVSTTGSQLTLLGIATVDALFIDGGSNVTGVNVTSTSTTWVIGSVLTLAAASLVTINAPYAGVAAANTALHMGGSTTAVTSALTSHLLATPASGTFSPVEISLTSITATVAAVTAGMLRTASGASVAATLWGASVTATATITGYLVSTSATTCTVSITGSTLTRSSGFLNAAIAASSTDVTFVSAGTSSVTGWAYLVRNDAANAVVNVRLSSTTVSPQATAAAIVATGATLASATIAVASSTVDGTAPLTVLRAAHTVLHATIDLSFTTVADLHSIYASHTTAFCPSTLTVSAYKLSATGTGTSIAVVDAKSATCSGVANVTLSASTFDGLTGASTAAMLAATSFDSALLVARCSRVNNVVVDVSALSGLGSTANATVVLGPSACSGTVSPTVTVTATEAETVSGSPTRSGTRTLTATRSHTGSGSSTLPPTATRTVSATRTASETRTTTTTLTRTDSNTVTPPPTVTRTASATVSLTAATLTRTRSATRQPTSTVSATQSRPLVLTRTLSTTVPTAAPATPEPPTPPPLVPVTPAPATPPPPTPSPVTSTPTPATPTSTPAATTGPPRTTTGSTTAQPGTTTPAASTLPPVVHPPPTTTPANGNATSNTSVATSAGAPTTTGVATAFSPPATTITTVAPAATAAAIPRRKIFRLAGGNWTLALRDNYPAIAAAVAVDVSISVPCPLDTVRVHSLSVGSLVADVSYVEPVAAATGGGGNATAAATTAAPRTANNASAWSFEHTAALYQPFAAAGEVVEVLAVFDYVPEARAAIRVVFGLGIAMTTVTGLAVIAFCAVVCYITVRAVRCACPEPGEASDPVLRPHEARAQYIDETCELAKEQADVLDVLFQRGQGRQTQWSYDPNALPPQRGAPLISSTGRRRVTLQLGERRLRRPGSASTVLGRGEDGSCESASSSDSIPTAGLAAPAGLTTLPVPIVLKTAYSVPG